MSFIASIREPHARARATGEVARFWKEISVGGLNLGFDERTSGGHHIFRKQGVRELINIQRERSKAKAYQVRQVRRIILEYRLAEQS